MSRFRETGFGNRHVFRVLLAVFLAATLIAWLAIPALTHAHSAPAWALPVVFFVFAAIALPLFFARITEEQPRFSLESQIGFSRFQRPPPAAIS